MIVALYILAIISDAIGDALRDTKKVASHIFQALAVGALLCVPFFEFEWYMLIGYVFLRIGLFDYAYNISRGLKFYYIGSTSYWDILLKKLNLNYVHLMFIRSVLLVIAIIILL